MPIEYLIILFTVRNDRRGKKEGQMNIQSVPRIRGRLAQYELPEEYKDKWCFEISVWTFDGEKQFGDPIGPIGPFDTEEIAKRELKLAVRIAAESCEKAMGQDPSGKFMDMKNGGIVRPWENNS